MYNPQSETPQKLWTQIRQQHDHLGFGWDPYVQLTLRKNEDLPLWHAITSCANISMLDVKYLAGPPFKEYGPIDDFELKKLNNVTNLGSFAIEMMPITGQGFLELRDLTRLARLSLFETFNVDGLFENLSNFRQLKTLIIDSCPIDEPKFEGLSVCEKLELFEMRNCNLSDDIMMNFTGPITAHTVSLEDNLLTGKTLSFLSTLHKLKKLILDTNKIGAEGINVISTSASQNLAELSLQNNELDDNSINYISGMPQLTLLDLSNNHITDRCFETVSQLNNLTYLFLLNTGVTSKGVTRLLDTLPNCRISIKEGEYIGNND